MPATTITTRPADVKTAEQIKQDFGDKGLTFADWARKHGYTPTKVYRVLNSLDKGKRGKAHEIAVRLGLKAGSAEVHDTTTA